MQNKAKCEQLESENQQFVEKISSQAKMYEELVAE